MFGAGVRSLTLAVRKQQRIPENMACSSTKYILPTISGLGAPAARIPRSRDIMGFHFGGVCVRIPPWINNPKTQNPAHGAERWARQSVLDADQLQLVGEVAGCLVARLDLHQRRLVRLADLLGEPAAWVERAAGRRVGRVRDVALKDDPPTCLVGIGLGDRREQR